MADDAIEIDFQLTAEDSAKFAADTAKRFAVKPSKLRLAVPLVFVTVFGLLLFWAIMYAFAFLLGMNNFDFLIADLEIFTRFEFIASYGIILVCFVALLETLYENVYKDTKKLVLRMTTSSPNKAMLAPMHASLSKESIKVHSAFVNYTLQWNGVEKVEIQNDDFCIFDSPISAVCIPARFFASEQQKQDIVQKCQTWFLDANKNAA